MGKMWSLNFDRCISCKSTTRKHIGKGYCKICYKRLYEKLHKAQCSICKKERTISTKKDGKIICKSCYKKFYYLAKKKKCFICGKKGRIDKIFRNRPVCTYCYTRFFYNRPKSVCHLCREFRERVGYKNGKPICGYCYRKYCYEKPKKICDKCGRLDRIILIKNKKLFCMRCYKKLRREYYRALDHTRNAKIQRNGGIISEKDFKEILQRDKQCVYCGSNKNLTFDHIIPISKGGKSEFNNYVIACLSCNISKRDKDIFSWCKQKRIRVPQIILDVFKKGR